jgi:hypothetical protein
MFRNRTIFAFALPLAAATAPLPAVADQVCQIEPLLHEVAEMDRWSIVEINQWVNVARADGSRAASAPKTVPKDGTVVSLRYTREMVPAFLVPTSEFTFKSGWPLNPKFTFRAGEQVTVRGIRQTADGKPVYVLSGGQMGSRVLFATMDGVLCNRVINPGRPRANFLNSTFSSTPGGKLVPDEAPTSDTMTVKVVYLGSAAGTVKYREIWSLRGKVIADETVEYDTEAVDVEIGGLVLRQSSPTASSVKIAVPAIPERIEATKRIARHLKFLARP